MTLEFPPSIEPDELVLAIDQGGHASRSMVFDGRGQLLVEASAEIETRRPAPGRVEHAPEPLLASIEQTLTQVVQQLGPALPQLRVAGIATQRSSIVCWDRFSGAALSPVISWQDRRGAGWLEQFSDQAEQIRACTGLRLSAHYGVSKLHWCLNHLPAVQEALAEQRLAWGPLVSFLLFRLLDERPLKLDPANASRTLLWDLKRRDWSAHLLQLFGLPQDPLPQSVPSRHPYGTLTLTDTQIPMMLATGDQSAALFAFGRPDDATIYINMGTGAFLQRPQPAGCPDSQSLLGSILLQADERTLYALEGTVNGAGSALAWAQQRFQLTRQQLLEGLADWLAQCTDPPLFLNGVSGLGSPYWIADFPSSFVGEGDTPSCVVAVVESIVFLLQANIQAMAEQDAVVSRIVISGGLAVQDGLCQRLADLSGLPVQRPDCREATVRGLASLLVGSQPGVPTETADHFMPQANPGLERRYQCWCREMCTVLSQSI